eukprot:CAMPEP_0201136690 /NCGR_PEP_ID=MMETSP0850-20130426/55016_1 /ASSEMBLY_ACC=CAM_ASM_000622 /TAXON_ID=183588 /ORGANISM="Pseudo-nitzschia fraudulenta, Strain WWA7" /LENGTH=384 /DNA_ID=CAMNT_0047408005 /DNA_START=26 /DNA_END=1180 /DNA_ORIENTATION=+
MNENSAPWESASNDQAFREQAAERTDSVRERRAPQTTGEPSSPAITSVRWDVNEDNYESNNANDTSFLTSETFAASDAPQSNIPDGRRGHWRSCSDCLSRCSLSYFLHVWDTLLTLFWMWFIGYNLYRNKENESSRSTSMVLLLVYCATLTILNALRGFLWIWASLPSLSIICCYGCCFEEGGRNSRGIATVSKLATNLTLWLGVAYGTISVVAWFGPSSWLQWCDGLGTWCSDLIRAQTVMPIALTAASVIELLRWVFFKGQLSSSPSTSMEGTHSVDYYNDDGASIPSESSRHRPWWFSRRRRNPENNGGLRDPLLESGTTTNRQPSWATMSWVPFARSRSQNENNASNTINGDEEDVESVLDSLGEDWASRAESDPYWWTR